MFLTFNPVTFKNVIHVDAMVMGFLIVSSIRGVSVMTMIYGTFDSFSLLCDGFTIFPLTLSKIYESKTSTLSSLEGVNAPNPISPNGK
jgi:hypothetical protein